jgi:hypothetical protein
MKFQAVLLGVLACLAAQAAGSKPTQAAMYQPASNATKSLTGCVDEQNGQYVLLDEQMQKITNLESAGSDPEVFAKRVGQKVVVKGTESSGRKGVFTVTSIEKLSGSCGPLK